MNYLAHAYLSMKKEGIVTGNMISDFVKGKKQYELPAAVQKGIRMHRAIDRFTDSHQSTAIIKSYFRPAFRLYSGAFADIVYDHFLARDKSVFNSQEEIDSLTHHTIMDIEANVQCLPPAFVPVFVSMKTHNWLALYGHDWALQKSFEGLARRSRYLEEVGPAFEIFDKERDNMREAYLAFIPDLLQFNAALLNELIHGD